MPPVPAPADDTSRAWCISVVIPSYNRKHKLIEAVQSVLAQTRLPDEIVIVDDGSSDETADHDWAALSPLIQFVRHEHNRGGSAARNTGVQAAHCEWIALLDADDLWLPHKLEQQVNALVAASPTPEVVAGNVVWRRPYRPDIAFNKQPWRQDTNLSRYLMVEHCAMQTSSLLVKRTLLLDCPFDDQLRKHQDWDLVLRLQAHGAHFLYLHELLSVYRSDDDPQRISLRENNVCVSVDWMLRKRSVITAEAAAYYFAYHCLTRALRVSPIYAIASWLRLSRGSILSPFYGIAGFARMLLDRLHAVAQIHPKRQAQARIDAMKAPPHPGTQTSFSCVHRPNIQYEKTPTEPGCETGKSMYTLSICIPTYNRSRCLAELLDSIAAQNHPAIEIVVSDDASPDDTAAVMVGYLPRLDNLRFIRQPNNLGLDRNFLAVVEAARGDYVWLMGDDDRLEAGAVKAVLAALDQWQGVAGLTLGVIDFDPQFKKVTGMRTMPSTRTLNGAGEVFGTIADLLGFMSALVIDRRLWTAVCREEPIADFMNYYVQVYIVGKALQRRPMWGVLNTICVGYRSDNDQFLSKFGWIKRLRMDAVAYHEIETALFANDPTAAHAMRRRIFDTHIVARVVNAKTQHDSTPDIAQAIRLLVKHYAGFPKLWVFVIPLLLTPNTLLRKLRRLYQTHAPTSGRQRALKRSDSGT